jgi:hypothetical protein
MKFFFGNILILEMKSSKLINTHYYQWQWNGEKKLVDYVEIEFHLNENIE